MAARGGELLIKKLTTSVDLECLTNSVALRKGERLLLEVEPRAEAAPNKRPAEAWEAAARKSKQAKGGGAADKG